uniref:DUF4817 domain-containing protein n=1 Tax=Anoplophora glabripennis TaxID=217634 RepID=V5GSD3_ANOGL
MEKYTIGQCVFIVKNYLKFGENYTEIGRIYRTKYVKTNFPTNSTIRNIVNEFEETGSIQDQRSKVYSRNGRLQENIAAVNDSVTAEPNTSIRHRSQQLAIEHTT